MMMTVRTEFSLALLFVLSSHSLLGQNIAISGIISDTQTNKPVPYASVFLANTTIGCSSEGDGTFKLVFNSIPKFDLVASSVGYNLEQQSFYIKSDTALTVNVALNPKVTTLNEVIVVADTSGRAKNYTEFKRLFLGDPGDTRDVKILNPKDIHLFFDNENRTLFAQAKEPIKVDNKTLGYSVEYHLERFVASYNTDKLSFAGTASFKELEPVSRPQRGRWTRARRRAYKGSLDHMLSSILNNTLIEERFKVQIVYPRFRPPDKVIEDKLLIVKGDSITFYKNLKSQANGSRVRSPLLHGKELLLDSLKKIIQCNEVLEVTYYPEENPNMFYFSTVKFLKGKVIVYGNGYFERFNIYTEGYMSRSGKIWSLLPLNYRPSNR